MKTSTIPVCIILSMYLMTSVNSSSVFKLGPKTAWLLASSSSDPTATATGSIGSTGSKRTANEILNDWKNAQKESGKEKKPNSLSNNSNGTVASIVSNEQKAEKTISDPKTIVTISPKSIELKQNSSSPAVPTEPQGIADPSPQVNSCLIFNQEPSQLNQDFHPRYKLGLILTRNCHNLTRIFSPGDFRQGGGTRKDGMEHCRSYFGIKR